MASLWGKYGKSNWARLSVSALDCFVKLFSDKHWFYYPSKHKPFVKPIKTEIDNNNETGQPTGADSVEVKNENEKDIGEVNKVTEDATTVTVTLKKSLDDETVVSIEEKEFLLGSYLGQYVIYTSATHAWLLL